MNCTEMPIHLLFLCFFGTWILIILFYMMCRFSFLQFSTDCKWWGWLDSNQLAF